MSNVIHAVDLKIGYSPDSVLGEIDNLEIKQGDRLQLGNDVILEVTGLCDPCARMDEIRDGLKDELDGQRGLLAYSETGGVVKVGDTIKSL